MIGKHSLALRGKQGFWKLPIIKSNTKDVLSKYSIKHVLHCDWYDVRYSGPVLSRFDRFLLIEPRAAGGPRASPTNQHKFALCIEIDCEYFRSGVQCFSMGFERPKRFLNYSNGLSKRFKVALLPPSKYPKTLLYNHLSIQIKQLQYLKISLQASKSNL